MRNTDLSPKLSLDAGKHDKGKENGLIYGALSQANRSLTRRELSVRTGIEIASLCRALRDMVYFVETVEVTHFGACATTGRCVMHYSLKTGKGCGNEVK